MARVKPMAIDTRGSQGARCGKVRTFLSGSSTLGESAVEVFVLESNQGADATRPR